MRVDHTDVVIIGGGSVGCATAYQLRRRGKRVTLLERGFVGAQSSGVNFGNLRLQGRHHDQMPLSLLAQEQWEGLEAELGESVEFLQGGLLFIARNTDQVASVEKYAAESRRAGLEIEMLEPRDIARRWPWLKGGALLGSWSPRDATVNSRLVSPAYARAARGLGAEIHESTEVTAIERLGDRFRVVTNRGLTVEAEVLLNSAGAWGDWIAAQFGEPVPIFFAGPVQMITEPTDMFLDGVMQVVDGSIIFRQTRRGNILIAGHPRVPVEAATLRTRPPPHKLAMNLARLLEMAPHLQHLMLLRSWTGIEGYFPDMVPIMSPSTTTPGLFHAFGFCGHGLQIAPAVGICLAEMIVDGRSRLSLESASIGRFEKPVTADRNTLAGEFEGSVLDKIGAR